jgi:flagellar protein FliO/FliZ
MEMDLFPSFVKMISALVIVLGAMAGILYLFRRISGRRLGGIDDGSLMRILASRYLGPKNVIVLVRVLDQVLAIGISNHRMSLLASFPESGIAEKIPGRSENKFGGMMALFRGSQGGPNDDRSTQPHERKP